MSAQMGDNSGGVAALDKAGAEKLLAGADKDTLLVLYAPWCPFCQGMEGAYAELAARLAGSHVRVAKLNADGDVKEWAKASLGLTTFPTIVMLPKAQPGKVVKYASERRDADSLQMWVKTLAGTA